ncbi:MAG: MBL fold metallo-hydrolase [Patescibacteria group bacterium]
MNITWYGYSCFKLEFGNRGNEKVSLVTDPFAKEGRNGLPRTLTAEIVTVSHDHERHNSIGEVGGNPFIIDGPGEYEVKDVMVNGVRAAHDDQNGLVLGPNVLYYITAEDLHIVHLGDLNHPLHESQFADIHNTDILFVPIGGKGTLDAQAAAEVIGQFEPRIVIPMHYRSGRWGEDLDGLDAFLKAMGVSEPETTGRFKITSRDLPQEETKIVVIEPQ